MSTLIIIRGLPGSGKTTIARQLEAKGFVHLEADMRMCDEHGKFEYSPDRVREAHDWCFRSMMAALAAGQDVVLANTYTRFFEFNRIIDAALDQGADVYIHECTGRWKSSHNVPSKRMYQMRRRWETLVDEEDES